MWNKIRTFLYLDNKMMRKRLLITLITCLIIVALLYFLLGHDIARIIGLGCLGGLLIWLIIHPEIHSDK